MGTVSFYVLDTTGYLKLYRHLTNQPETIKPELGILKSLPPKSKAALPPNPYRGLEVFRKEHKENFFGRTTEIAELKQLVEQQRLVAVIGASGSGKSSLVLAGLVPALEATGKWVISEGRPKTQPFEGLAAAFVSWLYPDPLDQLEKTKEFAKKLNTGGIALPELVRYLQAKFPQQRFLLIIDQFEEVFTLTTEVKLQQRFLDRLLEGVQAELPLTLLFTLRADFMGQVLAYAPLATALDRHAKKLLSAMETNGLREAIEAPAKRLGVTLEAGLTQRILDDVGQEPGNLPLLEFALSELWQKQQYGDLTHAAYKEIGGVQLALARYADKVYEAFDATTRAQVRQVFMRLVRPGEGTGDTRQMATRDEVRDWESVRKLADARLVVTGQDENTHQDTVEVVHEALIRHWQPLQQWVKEDRKFLVWLHDLRHKEEEWRGPPDEGLLLRGFKLEEAREMLKKYGESISKNEKVFIEASEKLRIRKKRKKVLIWTVILVSICAIFLEIKWPEKTRPIISWFYDHTVYSYRWYLVYPTTSENQLLNLIGRQISKNQNSYGPSFIAWNEHDNWASLGISQFIWYPEGQEEPFTETFPDFVKFLQKQGVTTIPPWLQNTPHCPWRNRQEFFEDSNSLKMESLRKLMKETVRQQVLFLVRRWQQALSKMLETLPTSSQRKHVREQFYRVAQTPKGFYALIDYVNFKGEGISPKERYQGQGWGLLQVLEQMSGDSIENAATEFAKAAAVVLRQLIQNASIDRKTCRFLAGWKNRLDTYAKFNPVLTSDSTSKFYLKTTVNQIYASALVWEGEERLASQGQLDQALAKYAQALQLDPEVEIAAKSWETLCYFGNLYQQAEKVAEACERAEALKEMPVARWLEGWLMGVE